MIAHMAIPHRQLVAPRTAKAISPLTHVLICFHQLCFPPRTHSTTYDKRCGRNKGKYETGSKGRRVTDEDFHQKQDSCVANLACISMCILAKAYTSERSNNHTWYSTAPAQNVGVFLAAASTMVPMV